MRFRLTYEGPLRASQGEPQHGQREPESRAAHKHSIRKVFHHQLKELWTTNKFLKEHKMQRTQDLGSRPVGEGFPRLAGIEKFEPMVDIIAGKYQRKGYRFVPLVRDEISLLCSLDVLFLRRDYPGGLLLAGDLDNRLKTLIDALRMPINDSELAGNETPGLGEDPFFCLLEDDKQVTKLSVETDTLLEIPDEDRVGNHVHLVITVDLKPYYATMFNLSFS